MGSAIVAAILGAAATQASAGWPKIVCGILAAVAAGLSPILGRHILEVKHEQGWIKARSSAEAIKSECFRFAAALGDYAGSDADTLFPQRCQTFAQPALDAGVTPLVDPETTLDARRPDQSMTVDWYLSHRLREQRDQFYAKAQFRHERVVSRLRMIGLSLGVLGVVLGAVGAYFPEIGLGAWIGVATTVGAMIVAQGFLSRHQYLAATYGMMIQRLSNLEATYFKDMLRLVDATETLLNAENAGWAARLVETIPPPPLVPDGVQKPETKNKRPG